MCADYEKPQIPKYGYFRLTQILGNPHAKPKPIPPIIPVKKSCWYKGIRDGIFPSPVHLNNMALWRCADIAKLIERIEKGELEL
jgi:hypothetical protein